MRTTLDQHIRKFIDLTEHEASVLFKHTKRINLKKKDLLLIEGKVCTDLYFIEKGCLRMYFVNKKSAEQITLFAIDGWWISDHFSFMDGTPTEYYLQAVEQSDIVAIGKQSLDDLLKELPKLERYFRIVMQKAVAASQLRSKYLYEMTKEEFYQHFSTSFPDFMQRVPQYMIASYLGLSAEYVSELRKKKTG